MKLLMVTGALAILSTSCSPPNFTKYNVLGNLRILTIIADQPEVNPGTTVNFTPVLSDLNGAGRILNYSLQGCIDPGVGIGATPVCSTPDPGSIQSGTVMIAAGATQTYTGPVTPFSLAMPDAGTVFASRSASDQFNGVAYLAFYTVSVPSGGPSVSAFVRVLISQASKTSKNQNPILTSVNRDGSPVSGVFSMPTAATIFSAVTSPSSAETYQTLSPTGVLSSQTEQLVNTWFVSDGTFDFQRTVGNADNSWAPPGVKPAPRGLVILVVTRDGRDGAIFQKVEMN